jgi:hypothetical protein
MPLWRGSGTPPLQGFSAGGAAEARRGNSEGTTVARNARRRAGSRSRTDNWIGDGRSPVAAFPTALDLIALADGVGDRHRDKHAGRSRDPDDQRERCGGDREDRERGPGNGTVGVIPPTSRFESDAIVSVDGPQVALTSPGRAAGQPPDRNVRSARTSSGVNKTAKKR